MCSFPDVVVRGQAVRWLQSITSDELVDYLPQLVQAVKHEAWDSSTLARSEAGNGHRTGGTGGLGQLHTGQVRGRT